MVSFDCLDGTKNELVCYNCFAEGHQEEECQNPKPMPLHLQTVRCSLCKAYGHHLEDCPNDKTECGICGATLRRPSKLRRHLRRIHGVYVYPQPKADVSLLTYHQKGPAWGMYKMWESFFCFAVKSKKFQMSRFRKSGLWLYPICMIQLQLFHLSSRISTCFSVLDQACLDVTKL